MSPEQPANDPMKRAGRIGDHLANERTFLAWVRTAIGLIGLGFVVARMGLFLRESTGSGQPIHLRGGQDLLITGVCFLFFGSGLCALAGQLYQRARIAIDIDRYQPASRSVTFLTALVTAGGLTITGLIVWHVVVSD